MSKRSILLFYCLYVFSVIGCVAMKDSLSPNLLDNISAKLDNMSIKVKAMGDDLSLLTTISSGRDTWNFTLTGQGALITVLVIAIVFILVGGYVYYNIKTKNKIIAAYKNGLSHSGLTTDIHKHLRLAAKNLKVWNKMSKELGDIK